jgi:hypothetical protein
LFPGLPGAFGSAEVQPVLLMNQAIQDRRLAPVVPSPLAALVHVGAAWGTWPHALRVTPP